MSTPVVALVIVSHSRRIAEGVVELAGQMAPGTAIVAAGGTDDGGIGTSFDAVTAAITGALGAHPGGVVILCDLGSAILTAETALEFLEDDLRGAVAIADAPIVEGAVAAAVAAEGGGDRAAVVAAAETARGSENGSSPRNAGGPAPSEPSAAVVTATTSLVNRDGLHARPAAGFVTLASTFDATVTVNEVDARSLLRIMSLGLGAGSAVTIKATGPAATEAVQALVELVDSGFGEPRV